MKLILTTAAVILASLALMPRANAQLVDVDFSFSNFYGGTITGELVGLTDNATSAPTDVIIFSGTTKTKYDPSQSLPETLPFDLSKISTANGSFTLVNGVVTAVVAGMDGTDFSVSQTTGNDQLTLIFGAGVSGVSIEPATNSLTDTVSGLASFYAENPYGFNGVVFSAGTPDVAVPEPSAYALALLGLGILAMLKVRRQRAKD